MWAVELSGTIRAYPGPSAVASTWAVSAPSPEDAPVTTARAALIYLHATRERDQKIAPHRQASRRCEDQHQEEGQIPEVSGTQRARSQTSIIMSPLELAN